MSIPTIIIISTLYFIFIMMPFVIMPMVHEYKKKKNNGKTAIQLAEIKYQHQYKGTNPKLVSINRQPSWVITMVDKNKLFQTYAVITESMLIQN